MHTAHLVRTEDLSCLRRIEAKGGLSLSCYIPLLLALILAFAELLTIIVARSFLQSYNIVGIKSCCQTVTQLCMSFTNVTKSIPYKYLQHVCLSCCIPLILHCIDKYAFLFKDVRPKLNCQNNSFPSPIIIA